MLRRRMFAWNPIRLVSPPTPLFRYAPALVTPRRARLARDHQWGRVPDEQLARWRLPPPRALAADDRPAPSRLLLITPEHFAVNGEALVDNVFMSRPFTETEKGRRDAATLAESACAEHAGLVAALEAVDVNVVVLAGNDPDAPDATFANNWLSVHPAREQPDGRTRIVVYPMALASRRREVRTDVLDVVRAYHPESLTVDLRGAYEGTAALEGTGSLVLDRAHRTVFATLSQRTHLLKLREFAEKLGYRRPIFFHAHAPIGGGAVGTSPIYHTNVVLALGATWAVVCFAAISESEQAGLREHFAATGRTVLDITIQQMRAYCANILEVVNRDGRRYTVMSTGAAAAFRPEQLAVLGAPDRIVAVPFGTLEKYGGGGVRCCLTEI